MRVYLVGDSVDEVAKHVTTVGAVAVKEILSPDRHNARNLPDIGEPDVATEEEKALYAKRSAKHYEPDDARLGEWRRLLFQYGLMYGDYGGKAWVDMRLRARGDGTVVLVFMYEDGFVRRHADQVDAIANSLR